MPSNEWLLITVGAILVNNVVLSRILGICPFLGVSKKLETALGMSGAVTFVLTISSFVTAVLYKLLLSTKITIFGTEVDLSFTKFLVFIVVIIAFNIYSSLKMLIIEKQADMGTLRSLGAPEALLRRIFLLEGWLVSLLGMAIGLVLGIIIVLLQQRFGLVPMPGNFAVSSYPVALKFSDILWTVIGVAGVGFLMALIPSRKLE